MCESAARPFIRAPAAPSEHDVRVFIPGDFRAPDKTRLHKPEQISEKLQEMPWLPKRGNI